MALSQQDIKDIYAAYERRVSRYYDNYEYRRHAGLRLTNAPQRMMIDRPLFQQAVALVAPVMSKDDFRFLTEGNSVLYADGGYHPDITNYYKTLAYKMANTIADLSGAAGGDGGHHAYISGYGSEARLRKLTNQMQTAFAALPAYQGSQNLDDAKARIQQTLKYAPPGDYATPAERLKASYQTLHAKRESAERDRRTQALAGQRPGLLTAADRAGNNAQGLGLGVKALQAGVRPDLMATANISNRQAKGLLTQAQPEATPQPVINPAQQFDRLRIQNTPGLQYRQLSDVKNTADAGYASTGSVLTKNYGRRV